MRVYSNGSGSFKQILKGYHILKKQGVRVNILCAVGPHNMKDLEKNILFLSSLKPDAIAINLPRQLHEGKFVHPQNKKIIQKYCNSVNVLYEQQIPELNFLKLIKGFFDKTIPIRPCSACGSQIAISPDNYIGPCQAFLNNKNYFSSAKKFKNKEEILKNEDFHVWANINKLKSKTCRNCNIMPLCMDDCPMDRKNFKGDLFEPTSLQCNFRKEMVNLLLERLTKGKRLEFKK